MTIDEHIHKAEEDAKMAEFDMEWGIGNYFIDRTEALEYAKECRQLAEWLKDYKRLKEQEPKWIPVSERLPDNNDDVLVYDYSDIFVAWYSGIDGNWCSADNRFDEYTPIIAWQPLPEPYEPQESEEI